MINISYGGINYRVKDRDDLNYVVEREKVSENGNSRWEVRGYPTTGKSAAEVLKRAVLIDQQEILRYNVNRELDVSEIVILPEKKSNQDTGAE